MRLALTILSAATAAAASCPSEDWQQLFDMCYWKSTFTMPWTSVATTCGSLYSGATPVMRVDFTINSFLSDRVMEGRQGWIGLCCDGECPSAGIPTDFSWLDGSPLEWELWETQTAFHGNGSRCAYINSAGFGQWNALVESDTSYPVLCQISAV